VQKQLATTGSTSGHGHQAFADHNRESRGTALASALADLRARAESFSKPVYDAGWKFPIASMLAFSHDLQGWAEAIETIADAGETPAP
jgi:hypothetical protein